MTTFDAWIIIQAQKKFSKKIIFTVGNKSEMQAIIKNKNPFENKFEWKPLSNLLKGVKNERGSGKCVMFVHSFSENFQLSICVNPARCKVFIQMNWMWVGNLETSI